MSYRATLDVPIATVRTISGRLTAHRHTHDAQPHQRAATTWGQAVVVLRWLKDGTDVRALARDSAVSQATAYRYLHETQEVIAQRSPDITDVLDRLRRRGEPFVRLDGPLVRIDRVAARTQAGNHLWYSGKHKAFGGNVQVLTDHTGLPVWTAPVEPGSPHDITAAQAHALPALYRAASLGLPTVADKGYTGAGIGIKVPDKNPDPDPDTRWRNELITCMRAPAERANAPIKHFKPLRHVTLSPTAVTTIAAAALVTLTHHKDPW